MSNLALISQMIFILKLMFILYFLNKIHSLSYLVIMEFMAMSASALALANLASMNFELYLILLILIIMITESVLGLSMLINLIRTHSNDFIKSSSILLS